MTNHTYNLSMDSSIIEEFKRSWLTSSIGFLLWAVGIWLLCWNEGRAVYHAHSLDEAFSNVISLNPYEPVRAEYDGRLVHITGELNIGEPLTEPEYGISVQAVKLKRRVQMYQWVEERTQRDYGDTVVQESSDNDYYYVTEWRDKLVDSSNFYIRHGHQNPKELPLKTHVYVSSLVKVGHLILGPELKARFTDYVEVTSDERPERRDIKLHLGIYYHCLDVWNPEVGDIRVQFYYAGLSGEPVTIIALQKDGVLVPYTTSKSREILLLRSGHLGISEMFHAEHVDARLATWKLRGAGVFILFASVTMLARLLRLFFIRVPLLCNVFSYEVTTSANLAISVSVSLFTIATAWMLYRPMLGAGLFMAAVSPFLYLTMGVYNVANNFNGNNYNRL